MPGTAKIITTRKGVDCRTSKVVDCTSNSDHFLHFFAKGIRSVVGGAIAHGMLYPPEVLIMKELPANTQREEIKGFYHPGSLIWKCPIGVSEVEVHCWGGGGAGGGLTTDNTICKGGGGAGGQYARKIVSVVAGQNYSISVGAGGVGSTGNGGNGEDSIFGNNLVVAKGGAGGKSYENGARGGIGSISGGIGTIVRKGGDGSNGGNGLVGGAGGGAGGTETNGIQAVGNNKGTGGIYNYVKPKPAFTGTGNGAESYDFFSHNGFSGSIYGGGGGGGANDIAGYTQNREGGAGGHGQVILKYVTHIQGKKAMVNSHASEASISQDYVTVPLGTYIDTYTGIVTPKPFSAVWIYPKLKPIPTNPDREMPKLLKKNFPVIWVGNNEFEPDRGKRLHTYYDAMKIYKTGILHIHKDPVTYHQGEDLVEETYATFDHNLGYIPMFAPFVDINLSLDAYNGWLNQFHYRRKWALNKQYFLKDRVEDDTTGDIYLCKKSHLSNSSNQPNLGASYQGFWEKVVDSPDMWVANKSYLVKDLVSIRDNSGYWNVYRCTTAHISNVSNQPAGNGQWWNYWTFVNDNSGMINEFKDIVLNDMEDIKFIYGGVSGDNGYYVDYYATEDQLVLKLTRVTYDWESQGWENEPLKEVDVTVHYTVFCNRADMEYNLLLD